MKTTLSVLSAALLLNMTHGANAFSVRMVPVARTLTPRLVSAMITPESRLDRALRDPFSLLDTLGKEDSFLYGLQPLLRRALQATDLAGPVMEGLGGFKVDVMETEKSYLIHADLPGCRKEDVKVTFTDGVLEIAAERRQEYHNRGPQAVPEPMQAEAGDGEKEKPQQQAEKESKVKYYASEVTYGSLLRSFRLPSDADSENIGASFENGVLKIELPKRQSPSKKTVEII